MHQNTDINNTASFKIEAGTASFNIYNGKHSLQN
jgi:hypothetical protein